jgi:hypothetical protein
MSQIATLLSHYPYTDCRELKYNHVSSVSTNTCSELTLLYEEAFHV